MKTKTIIITLLYIWFFNVSVNAQNKQGPTLEQTIKFIQFNSYNWNVDGETVYYFSEIAIKDKTLYATSRNMPEDGDTKVIYIHLDRVDDIVKADDGIILKSTQILGECTKSWSDKNIQGGRVGILTKAENVEKVYKAFRHLLDLLDIKFEEVTF